MRSYETSRTIFGFIEALSWLATLLGGVLFAVGMNAIFDRSGFGGQFAALLMVPGVIFLVFGLLTIVVAQSARAGVDTAELTSQVLKVARDQLEVSKQALRASEAVARTYESLLPAAEPDRPMADYGAAFATGRNGVEHGAEHGAGPTKARTVQIEAPSEPLPEGAIPYLGYTILPQTGNFWVGDQFFTSLAAAQRYVEILKEDT